MNQDESLSFEDCQKLALLVMRKAVQDATKPLPSNRADRDHLHITAKKVRSARHFLLNPKKNTLKLWCDVLGLDVSEVIREGVRLSSVGWDISKLEYPPKNVYRLLKVDDNLFEKYIKSFKSGTSEVSENV